jgi:hypothetical protein
VRRRWRVLIGLVGALGVCSTGVALAVNYEPPPLPLEVTAPDFHLRGSGDGSAMVPIHHFHAAQALVATLVSYPGPDPAPDAVPNANLPNPTHEGFPLVVEVLDQSPDNEWLQVRLPMRPNGSVGWVRTRDMDVWSVPNRIVVQVGTNTITVFDGDSDHVLFQAIVATGRPNTPTPLGDFFIDIVNPLGHDRVYGWGQLSVAGFSDVLQSFGGGIGQIAIHGWNNDSVMGTHASNGCVRMRNVDIEQLASLATLGTPVSIVA